MSPPHAVLLGSSLWQTISQPVSVIALALSLSLGCISSQGGIERTQTLWTIGQTTRRDVVASWGGPDAVFGDVWVWRNRTTAGGQLKASFMMIGATVRNLVFSAYEHRLTFGPDGRLVDEQVVDFTPGQDEWSINPWD